MEGRDAGQADDLLRLPPSSQMRERPCLLHSTEMRTPWTFAQVLLLVSALPFVSNDALGIVRRVQVRRVTAILSSEVNSAMEKSTLSMRPSRMACSTSFLRIKSPEPINFFLALRLTTRKRSSRV